MTRGLAKVPPMGAVFGRLTVLSEQPFKLPKGKRTELGVVCECVCGNKDAYRVGHLRSGHTQSCGCFHAEQASQLMRTWIGDSGQKHGLANHPHAKRWYEMMYRCYNENNHAYDSYGGRGISVHEAWHDLQTYVDYLDNELGPCPEGYSLDRIDNDGNYEPGNCRWADAKTQMNNRRVSKNRDLQ